MDRQKAGNPQAFIHPWSVPKHQNPWNPFKSNQSEAQNHSGRVALLERGRPWTVRRRQHLLLHWLHELAAVQKKCRRADVLPARDETYAPVLCLLERQLHVFEVFLDSPYSPSSLALGFWNIEFTSLCSILSGFRISPSNPDSFSSQENEGI